MKFYRVSNTDTGQGLWYNYNGQFTGLIHDKFKFCKVNELKMDFDPELVGWLSATKTMEELYNWFSEGEIKQLQDHGWYIHEYEVTRHKWYERFEHFIIKQDTSILTKRIIIL